MQANTVKYEYPVFINENWQYNVDKVFFIVFLGMLYSFIRLWQNNFEASFIELVGRMLSGPFVVLAAIVLIEALAAVIVKIGFEPGSIVETKFKIIIYDKNNKLVWKANPPTSIVDENGIGSYRAIQSSNTASYQLENYDGSLFDVYVIRHYKEYRVGTGLFKWIGYIVPKHIFNSVIFIRADENIDNILFTEETIDILPNETIKEAIAKICDKECNSIKGKYRLKFIKELK